MKWCVCYAYDAFIHSFNYVHIILIIQYSTGMWWWYVMICSIFPFSSTQQKHNVLIGCNILLRKRNIYCSFHALYDTDKAKRGRRWWQITITITMLAGMTDDDDHMYLLWRMTNLWFMIGIMTMSLRQVNQNQCNGHNINECIIWINMNGWVKRFVFSWNKTQSSRFHIIHPQTEYFVLWLMAKKFPKMFCCSEEININVSHDLWMKCWSNG